MCRTQLTVAAVLLFVFLGCAQGAGNSPIIPDTQIAGSNLADSGRTVWGVFDILIDPENPGQAVITPIRAGSFHTNIRTFLEDGPCTDCLSVIGVIPTVQGMNIEINIDHPFGGMPDLYGFDVRGTVFFDGNFEFPALDITASSPAEGDVYITNPDGYTTIFNPTEYPGGGLFDYSRGKMVPSYMPNPSATLGAFRAFYTAGQSENNGGRRAFFPGDSVSRIYEIVRETSGLFRFGYVVDSCWEAPIVSPAGGPDDFPVSANCYEPYRLDIEINCNSLSEEEGGFSAVVLAYDHQEIGHLWQGILEAPGLTDELIYDQTPEIVSANIVRYDFNVTNELGSADWEGEEILVMVVHEDSDPNLGLIPAVGFTVVDVSPVPLPPNISAIEPDHGSQGSTVQVTITGSNFKDGATVELYQSINALPGYGVEIDDQFTLQAYFDLTGPLGSYTVYVENPDGKWGELPDAFEVLQSWTDCSTAFHTDTLGTGEISGICASQFDCAFLTEGPYAGRMIATMQNVTGRTMAAVDVDTTTPSDPILFSNALGNIGWTNAWTIDVDETTGYIYITWFNDKTKVGIYSSSGEPVKFVQLDGMGEIRGLDTDGEGGFWVAFDDAVSDPHFLYHLVPEPFGSDYLVEETVEIDNSYGRIEEVAVLPGDRLYVLCTAQNGTILVYNLLSASLELDGFMDHCFPGPLPLTSQGRAADIEIDQTDPDNAACRIVVMGNQGLDSAVLIKFDRDLNLLKSLTVSQSFFAMAINPDPIVATHHVTLFPSKKDSSTYRLLETPTGW